MKGLDMRNDKTSLIERLADAEQRLGVSFNALYAYTEGKWAHLNGEIDLRRATGNDLRIVANFYDSLGRMIETVEHYIEAGDGETFEAFNVDRYRR